MESGARHGTTEQKRIAQQVEALKNDLKKGNASRLLALLADTPSQLLLKGLREQKILFRVQEDAQLQEVAQALKKAAEVALTGSAISTFQNYVDFALLSIQVSRELTSDVQMLLQALPHLSLFEMLEVVHETFETLFSDVAERLPPLQHPTGVPIPQSVAASEAPFA